MLQVCSRICLQTRPPPWLGENEIFVLRGESREPASDSNCIENLFFDSMTLVLYV